MKLSRLAPLLAPTHPPVPGPDPEITAVHHRAQDVTPGSLFVAVPGFVTDGHAFVPEAERRGAAAVVAQRPVAAGVPVIQVADSRRALSRAAAEIWGRPSERMVLVGVTGTNGKTTVTYLLEAILTAAGARVGIIGTVNYRYGGVVYPAPHTTPEASELQRILGEMLAAGTTHVVMEVASHALALHRVDDCRFDVGVFTNLTQDHLDFHGDMPTYWEAKRRLFTELLAQGPKAAAARAVINTDDPRGPELLAACRVPALAVGTGAGCTVHARASFQGLEGLAGRIETPAGGLDFLSPLVGAHNLANILSAAGAATALALPLEALSAGLVATRRIPGRLERVPDPRGARTVFVDYAHTPDALQNVLAALRQVGPRRLICLFGCGGDRDRAKRPLMGAIAGRLADVCLVTSDNPRSEDPEAIIAEILPGLEQAGARAWDAAVPGAIPPGSYMVLPDRRAAIRRAVALARPGDAVLLAGKGHEAYQVVGARRLPFDDVEEAAAALAQVDPPGGAP